MRRVEAAHRYDVPVERAFAFITDPANWPRFWPGFVRLEEGSAWTEVGDTARLVTELLGRERLLTMTITAFERDRLVTYTSTQPGLPDAEHERHFEPDDTGFVYRLVVQYAPRGGIAGASIVCLSPVESSEPSGTRSPHWSGSSRRGTSLPLRRCRQRISVACRSRQAHAPHHSYRRASAVRIRVASRAGRLVAATTTSTAPIGIRASDHHGARTASSVVPLAAMTRAR